jgi:hypothetical protein
MKERREKEWDKKETNGKGMGNNVTDVKKGGTCTQRCIVND